MTIPQQSPSEMLIPAIPEQCYPDVRDWGRLSEQEQQASEAEQSQIDIAAGR